jgi:hypothetical protein
VGQDVRRLGLAARSLDFVKPAGASERGGIAFAQLSRSNALFDRVIWSFGNLASV